MQDTLKTNQEMLSFNLFTRQIQNYSYQIVCKMTVLCLFLTICFLVFCKSKSQGPDETEDDPQPMQSFLLANFYDILDLPWQEIASDFNLL